jgi:hypothetical protein
VKEMVEARVANSRQRRPEKPNASQDDVDKLVDEVKKGRWQKMKKQLGLDDLHHR